MVKRRFIAGAECPSCAMLDTLYVYSDALDEAFECAACGYREERPIEPNGGEIQAVKFIDASEPSSDKQ